MIEAMACGTRVLAFRCGSIPEIIENGVTGEVVRRRQALATAPRADVAGESARSPMLGAGVARLRSFRHHQFEGRLPFTALTAGVRPVTPSNIHEQG